MEQTYEWSEIDLAHLRELEAANESLPADSPRALLSVRLSVFTDDTTSPVRQELDLRRLALERGHRVVGVASDLGVSATKVPPWKRKSLGDWLNNRVPEFDTILFWKLDRFIRNLTDLNVMIRWAETYHKNLVSKNDPIDLTTTMGKIMVTFIGGVAEIEAANTKLRVESLWAYAKGQEEWVVGKPPYGYTTTTDETGRRTLTFKEDEVRALNFARERLLAGDSLTAITKELKERGLMSEGLQVSTLKRRLSNPGLLGYRVEENKSDGVNDFRRSKLVLNDQGDPIRVGPAIFERDEWDEIQRQLAKRAKAQPGRPVNQRATKFLGVLKCADCGSNMTVKRTTYPPNEKRRNTQTLVYEHLRCQTCKSGGLGAPNPQAVYDALVAMVLEVIGDFPIESREYARGEEMRQRVTELQNRIAYYMKGLEPGGRLTKTKFSEQQAEAALDAAIAELEGIDPETTEDRWIYVDQGKTFREHWEEGGMEQMQEDLLRAGIECVVTRTKVPRQRSPKVDLKLRIPKDVRQRLIRKADDFENPL
jgi:DNA invertase Pin-like site-specific DNA recombinase